MVMVIEKRLFFETSTFIVYFIGQSGRTAFDPVARRAGIKGTTTRHSKNRTDVTRNFNDECPGGERRRE